jgi:glutathione reductase (NADPH)
MAFFDIIVIGTGSGRSVANKCVAAGKKVAIIDNNPYGGTCQLRGCDPKKLLIGFTEAIELSNRLMDKGMVTAAKAVWKDMILFKRSFTAPAPSITEERFKEAGVTTYHGRARFTSESTLQIGDQLLTANRFVLANGAKPVKLGIPGEELLIDSTEFLDLDDLPEDLLLVGGGYIAFEFGHLAARLGVKVKIIDSGEQPLKNFEPDLVRDLLKATEALGVEVILNTEVKRLTKIDGRLLVWATSKGKEVTFTTSLAVHAAGRSADIEDLQLEKANVVHGKKGIEVNDYLQSVSNPNVYAAGDVNNRGLHLTPVAAKESIIVASNLLKGNHHKIDYGHIPSNVFTIPALSSVGLTEQQAVSQKLNFKVNYEETTEWFSSKQLNEPVSSFKVLIDKDSDQIIGAHLLGPNAGEVINIFTVAMNAQVKASQLKKMIFSYPTSGSDIVYML